MHPCKSEVQKVRECWNCTDLGKISQWEQGVAALREINNRIAAAVGEVQRWASAKGWSPTLIQMATPDLAAWEKHQAWDADSWVFKNDTWIHPSAEGHKQLAKTAMQATCKSWGQWCGARPAWLPNPNVKTAVKVQAPAGKIPSSSKKLKTRNLPNVTKQHNALAWETQTPKICRIELSGELVTLKGGTCRITAYAARSGPDKAFKKSYAIKVA